jgi:membrane protein YdbS with pleckstrin-like domain
VAISSKLLNDGENIVVSTRTHVKALLFPLLVLIVCLAVGVWLGSLIGDSGGGIPRLVVWILLLLVILWFFVRPLLEWLTTTYTITNRRLITRTGVLTRRGHDIPLARISDVATELGIIDRMLGCGTIIISDASTDGSVLLKDIPRAEDVQRELNELLHKFHGGSDDGT